MAGYLSGLIGRRTLRRWDRVAGAVEKLDPKGLKALRSEARALSRRLEETVRSAEGRLAVNLAGPPAVRRPVQSDWGWRPGLWGRPVRAATAAEVASGTPVGDGIKLFHDCPRAEIAFRQVRNADAGVAAPYGFRVEVFGFEGSFLSLAIDLPREATAGLSARHVFRVETHLETERRLAVYVRLNLRQGPNLGRWVAELSSAGPILAAEIDLGAESPDIHSPDHGWIDLIFEGPGMNAVVVRDLTLSRRPRAEF